MNDMTVSEVSRELGISTRMLRYYEKEGLISTKRREDYAYRMYDELAVRRLRQIVILRKLRIPLKEIGIILNASDISDAVRVFLNKIQEIDGEISSLRVIRDTLSEVAALSAGDSLYLMESKLLSVSESLPPFKNTLKENKAMNESNTQPESREAMLDKANERADRTGENIRILQLPPFTVASNHVIGIEPEAEVDKPVDKFIRESGLYKIKPDARYFGFNHPNPGILDGGRHGYEVWVTIPDDMEVPEPLVKKHFDGGLFAALTIRFPDFHRWNDLVRWAQEDNELYEPHYSELGDEIMGGCLEEHLNWVYASHMGWPDDGIPGQLDLMLPIKRKG